MHKAIFLTLFIPAVLLSGCHSEAEEALIGEVLPGVDLSELNLYDAATDHDGTPLPIDAPPTKAKPDESCKHRARGKWRITNDGVEIPGVVTVDKDGVRVHGVVTVNDDGVYVPGVVRVDDDGVHVPGVVKVDDTGVYVPGVVTVTKDGIEVEGGITVDRRGVEIPPAPEAPAPETPSEPEHEDTEPKPERRLY